MRRLLLAVLLAACVLIPLVHRAAPASGSSPAGAAHGVAHGVALVATPDGAGYWIVAANGGVFTFGDAHFYGSMGGQSLNAPMVGMAATPDGGGYWLVASDGGIFAFGDAGSFGSMGGHTLNAPIVGMAATADGRGYWLVASDGGIFNFGDAHYDGSMGGHPLDAPVVGMAATANGGGYWLVASDGGIFTFGNATFEGSEGGKPLNRPIVGMARASSGNGYWLVASDGGIFTFGGAPFYGSTGAIVLNQPIVGLGTAPSGGYWLVASDGGVFSFGAADFHGSATADLNPIVVNELASTGGARQVIIVDAPSAASTTATLSTYENDGNGWYPVLAPIPAVDGVNGWVPGSQRSEGDGASPEGMYAIGSTMYGVDANPGLQFPYHRLQCGDWWDEDPNSATYNSFQTVPCGTTPPFSGNSEALWTEGNAYPYMAVIDYNTPPTGALGSGIFLHANIGTPTTGCISVPLSDLVQVLKWLNPALHPVIVMGPDSVIRSF
jgi:L,D-peptidoglycan transpeptidase YkuD (ErfK/YbiS/YcfS/YnhG family)